MGPILKKLGAEKDRTALGTPTGTVLRALTDRFFLGGVKLDTGGVRLLSESSGAGRIHCSPPESACQGQSRFSAGPCSEVQPDVEKAFNRI
jgi:hypothetical protein